MDLKFVHRKICHVLLVRTVSRPCLILPEKVARWAATPIVWADTIFITSAEEGFTTLDGGRRKARGEPVPDKIFLFAINRKDGAIRWRKQIDSGNQLFRKQNSASPSPITDGEHVWVMTGNGK